VPVDVLSVTLRSLSFIALFQAAGMVIFNALFGRTILSAAPSINRYAAISAWLALIFTASHYALEAARMSGDFSGLTDPSLQAITLHSSTATTFAVRAFGLLLIALSLSAAKAPTTAQPLTHPPPADSWQTSAHNSGENATVPRGKTSWLRWLALIGAALVVISFALTGHTTDHEPGGLLAFLLLTHVLCIAFWFGALLPLYLICKHESATTTGAVVARFSNYAIWLVPALFAAGVCLATLLLASFAALATPYGQLLLLKIAGFALLMLLASLNKWRLGPALSRGIPQTHAIFRYSLIAEFILIAAILTTTAILTTFYSPES
jgi:copper resistance protein D